MPHKDYYYYEAKPKYSDSYYKQYDSRYGKTKFGSSSSYRGSSSTKDIPINIEALLPQGYTLEDYTGNSTQLPICAFGKTLTVVELGRDLLSITYPFRSIYSSEAELVQCFIGSITEMEKCIMDILSGVSNIPSEDLTSEKYKNLMDVCGEGRRLYTRLNNLLESCRTKYLSSSYPRESDEPREYWKVRTLVSPQYCMFDVTSFIDAMNRWKMRAKDVISHDL